LIRPWDVLSEQVSDGAAVTDAAIARGDNDLHHIGEETSWRQVSRRLRLLEHRHTDTGTRCSDRECPNPGEPFDISNQQQPHRGLVDGNRLTNRSDQLNDLTNA
jgi:hypothetical protein